MALTSLPGAEKWASFYSTGVGNFLPDENLVRLVRGSWADIPRSGSALDLGFGIGANLVMLAQSGYEAYGLEVAQVSIDKARELAERAQVTLNLGLLEGTALPYADGTFDLVVSWNAIYYYGSRSLVRDAIAEIHRTLKPGGVFLASVIHPNSGMMHRLSAEIADGTHEIDRGAAHDNRMGTRIFFDPTSSGWREVMRPFADISEGYVETDLFAPWIREAWRLFLARKAA